MPDKLRGKAITQHSPQSIYQDGLAGTCLASQDIQALIKFYLNMLQESKIPYRKRV